MSGPSRAQKHFRLGVFMPVANNGWIISKNSPQYQPTYQLNKDIAQLAERIGFDYVFSMAKWSGYGGETRYWESAIESFTLMAALATATTRLRLVASIAPILVHPAIVAKTAVTIDDISGGRLAMNLVSSDTEYHRMGLYPDDFESYRHDYIDEWLTVVKRLWTGEPVDFRGKFFTLDGYSSNPTPIQKPGPSIVYATSSERGFQFVAEQCDEAFITSHAERNAVSHHLKEMARERGRTVQTQTHVTIIQGETDEEAQRIVNYYREGADLEAITNVYDRGYTGDKRKRGEELLEKRFPGNLFYYVNPLIGSPKTIADFIQDLMENGDFDGLLVSFPDYIEGLEKFNAHVMPLLIARRVRV